MHACAGGVKRETEPGREERVRDKYVHVGAVGLRLHGVSMCLQQSGLEIQPKDEKLHHCVACGLLTSAISSHRHRFLPAAYQQIKWPSAALKSKGDNVPTRPADSAGLDRIALRYTQAS